MTIQMKNTDKDCGFSNYKPQSKEVCQLLIKKLKRQNRFILTDKNPDIVISVGGDGMLLSVFHKYEKQLDKFVLSVFILDIGFYTDYRDFRN